MRHALVVLLVACAACSPSSNDLAEIVANAKPGQSIEVEAGTYLGPIVIDKPLTLTAAGPVVIHVAEGQIGLEIRETKDVVVSGITILGGEVGFRVWRSDDVTLLGVESEGAQRHGILVENSHVVVRQCEVSGLTGSYPRGVEVRNSELHEESVVEGCTVRGPVHEGIVSRLSHVRFHDNLVYDAAESGIAITEMSAGSVTSSAVEGGSGIGILCGDMSMCDITSNRISGLEPGDERLSTLGNGVVVQYHSVATIEDLTTSGISGEAIVTSLGGTVESPGSAPQPDPEG